MIATNLRAINRGGLLCTFDLHLPSGLILNDCRAFTRPDGVRFVCGPSKRIGEGATAKYQKLVEFATREVAEEFSRDALAALDALGATR